MHKKHWYDDQYKIFYLNLSDFTKNEAEEFVLLRTSEARNEYIPMRRLLILFGWILFPDFLRVGCTQSYCAIKYIRNSSMNESVRATVASKRKLSPVIYCLKIWVNQFVRESHAGFSSYFKKACWWPSTVCSALKRMENY